MLDGAWFGSLEPPLRVALLSAGRRMRLGIGETLHRQGDAGLHFYGVMQGQIRITSLSREGRELFLTVLNPGHWFGEICLIDALPRAHAAGVVTLLGVSKPQFDQLGISFPSFPHHLLKLMAGRLRSAFSYIDNSVLLPLPERLARRLLLLQAEFGGDTHIPLAQEKLAQMLGSTRQRINMQLRAWQKLGLVELRYRGLMLLDRAGLAQVGRGA